ncbi:MAG: discoidin domain-containing protein [Dehalococcoidia bacterium]|nr:discoidin domain-containing protein [Dehalococcoidia bacterium]
MRYQIFATAILLTIGISWAAKPSSTDIKAGTRLAESNRARSKLKEQAVKNFKNYCFDCHDATAKEGGLDLTNLLSKNDFDGSLMFEHLITAKMPPKQQQQPTSDEKRLMLGWLAEHQAENAPNAYRRISRHEFVYSANDLLGVKLDLTGMIPEDRGTHDFDSDRRIRLTRQMLNSYFTVADEMLEFALPAQGFIHERTWVTNKIKDSHKTYNIYTRNYKDGIIFSWTRANNGNSYSFFYDNFDPPVKGWYELTFDAAKLGAFKEDVSIEVFAGKYYYADDRPQPQRLLDVISLDNIEVKSYSVRVFLYPGENVSVHCYSKHNFRQKDGNQGAYIKQLKVRGPVLEQWPPISYRQIFGDLPLKAAPRETINTDVSQTNLKAIGGSVSVSSFQQGMEKEKMQDGSNRTFWHTQFKPTLAKPPHYVILENPQGKQIEGLSYATWSGGNGNGQVQAYAIHLSDDGKSWDEPIMTGELETRLANEQPINFPQPTTKRFIKFLVTDAFTLDGRSLASIGKLDVMTTLAVNDSRLSVAVSSESVDDLKRIIRRFAERAFSSNLTDEQLAPYYQVSLNALQEKGDFVAATKIGLKAIMCSHRFLLAPGEHENRSSGKASDLARILGSRFPIRNCRLYQQRICSRGAPSNRKSTGCCRMKRVSG